MLQELEKQQRGYSQIRKRLMGPMRVQIIQRDEPQQVPVQQEARLVEVMQDQPPPPVEPEQVKDEARRRAMGIIMRECCRYYGVSKDELLGPRRLVKFAFPRKVAMYLCYYVAKRSYPQIGMMMGDRDHTTIMSGTKKIKRALLAGDPPTTRDVELLTARITEAMAAQAAA